MVERGKMSVKVGTESVTVVVGAPLTVVVAAVRGAVYVGWGRFFMVTTEGRGLEGAAVAATPNAAAVGVAAVGVAEAEATNPKPVAVEAAGGGAAVVPPKEKPPAAGAATAGAGDPKLKAM